jgi:hypothetical protein
MILIYKHKNLDLWYLYTNTTISIYDTYIQTQQSRSMILTYKHNNLDLWYLHTNTTIATTYSGLPSISFIRQFNIWYTRILPYKIWGEDQVICGVTLYRWVSLYLRFEETSSWTLQPLKMIALHSSETSESSQRHSMEPRNTWMQFWEPQLAPNVSLSQRCNARTVPVLLGSFETSVIVYQPTRHDVRDDLNLQTLINLRTQTWIFRASSICGHKLESSNPHQFADTNARIR